MWRCFESLGLAWRPYRLIEFAQACLQFRELLLHLKDLAVLARNHLVEVFNKIVLECHAAFQFVQANLVIFVHLRSL